MIRKGSITVFLALVLSLLLSLLCAGIESVRMAAARTQILDSMDIGLYSLFGQYDKRLLEDFDLFFLDGSCGGGALDLAQVYDHMEVYLKPVLKQNSQQLSIVQGGFTGYRLATDDGGEPFYHQVVRYMEDTLGSQGVQLLLEKMRGRQEQTENAERQGDSAEEGNALENYENEMNEAARNSQEAENQQNAGEQPPENGQDPDVFGSGDGFSDGEEKDVQNPITIIKRIRRMGILELVVPADKGLSAAVADTGTFLSGRMLQQGMLMPGSLEKDTSYSSGILFQQYLLDRLGNYTRPSGKGLVYQAEYLFGGKDCDLDNLTAVAKKLLLIREGINFAYLLSDPARRAQAEALALAIASGFLIPPAAVVIEGALLLCWAFAESVLDVRELFCGGRVPLVKTASDWQISLENLSDLLDGLDSMRRGTDSGMSYEDYLHVLLLSRSREEKLRRGMDMIEMQIRQAEGREEFQLDSCIQALEASVDVRANGRNTYTVTRQYGYR